MKLLKLKELAKGPYIFNVAISIALVSVLVFLIFKTRAINLDEHNALLSDIRLLKQIDAEWNADVLKSKMGFSANYDPIASPLLAIRRLEESLASKSKNSSENVGGDLIRATAVFADYKNAMDQKIRLIEEFKSQNAILRNSTRFLPTSVADLVAMTPEKHAKDWDRTIALVRSIYADVMTYSVLPDQESVKTIESQLADLQQLTENRSDEIGERLGRFSSHVRAVLRQQSKGTAILSQLNELPTPKKIDELSDYFSREHDKLLLSQQTHRTALIAYASFLLILVAFIGFRLIRSYRKIGELNAAALKKANVQLNEVQLQLVQSEKMSALGQMVAGIAHEINTPLAFVKGTFDVVNDHMSEIKTLTDRCDDFLHKLGDKSVERKSLHKDYYELRDRMERLVKESIPAEMSTLLHDGSRGTEQISEIVINLKNFSRLDRAKITQFDVKEGLESTLLLMRNVLKDKVRIEKQIENVPKIECSPSQINQVFLNIISNAAQAMKRDDGVITLRVGQESEKMVRIEIQDDGSGIPPDVLPKIFDPFFTTKEIGKGTGMGLSISYKIIEEHGGKIIVDSEVGIGTTFTILLPIKQKKTESVIIEDDVAMEEHA